MGTTPAWLLQEFFVQQALYPPSRLCIPGKGGFLKVGWVVAGEAVLGGVLASFMSNSLELSERREVSLRKIYP